MTPISPNQPVGRPTLTTAARVELRRVVGGVDPALVAASRFLGARRGVHLLAAVGLGRIFASIIDGSALDERAGEGKVADATSCGCGGDSLDSRVQIARNVVDFLFHDVGSGPIGRVEMEAFAAVCGDAGWSEDDWSDLINALAQASQVQRVATFASGEALLGGLVAAWTKILTAGGNLSAESEAIRAIGLSMQWHARIFNLAGDWMGGALWVPLETLAAQGVRDVKFGAAIQSGHPDPASLDAVRAVLARAQLHATNAERMGLGIADGDVRAITLCATAWRLRAEEKVKQWSEGTAEAAKPGVTETGASARGGDWYRGAIRQALVRPGRFVEQAR